MRCNMIHIMNAILNPILNDARAWAPEPSEQTGNRTTERASSSLIHNNHVTTFSTNKYGAADVSVEKNMKRAFDARNNKILLQLFVFTASFASVDIWNLESIVAFGAWLQRIDSYISVIVITILFRNYCMLGVVALQHINVFAHIILIVWLEWMHIKRGSQLFCWQCDRFLCEFVSLLDVAHDCVHVWDILTRYNVKARPFCNYKYVWL